MSVRRIINKVLGRLPTQLPIGVTSFEAFVNSIFETYDIPNLNSYKHAVATMIMHLGPDQDKKSKYHFARAIRKAQANEIAYQTMQNIRLEEEKAKNGPSIMEAAEQARELTEATDTNQDASIEQPVQVA